MTRRLLVWRGVEEGLAETCELVLEDDRLRAAGTQMGAHPQPYRVDYELFTGAGWVTERLLVTAHDAEGQRSLDLRRDADGRWSADGEALPELEGALDCDLAFCPMTNTMPVLREGLRERSDAVDFKMAWVSVPDLSVQRSLQRYEPIDAHTVRYVARDGDFRADLDLDEDGLVVRYERMSERVEPGAFA